MDEQEDLPKDMLEQVCWDLFTGLQNNNLQDNTNFDKQSSLFIFHSFCHAHIAV